MRYLLVLPIVFLPTLSFAHSEGMEDPWWDESTQSEKSLPNLIDDGWQIVGFSVNHSDDSVSRDYILQHPEDTGAWHCNWFSLVTDDGANKIYASCSSIRRPTENIE